MNTRFTEKESLDLISRMIENTKTNVREEGHLYILWGITVPLAALLHYYFLHFPAGFPAGMVWPVIMLISGVLHGIFISRLVGEKRVTTFLDEAMRYIWTGFILAIFAVIAIMIGQSPAAAQPMFLVIYGMGTYATGGILGINSLKYGGIACFIFGAIAAFVGLDIQLLLLAAGSICGFLVPGLLIARNRRNSS